MLNTIDSPYTDTVSTYTDIVDSKKAGEFIAEKVQAAFRGKPADVIILFASSTYDYTTLLKAVNEKANPKILVGCSSAGEFTNEVRGDSSVSAIAIRSDEIAFAAGLSKNLSDDVEGAAKGVVSAFNGIHSTDYPYHTALILTDALAGYTDTLIDKINSLTAGIYQLFGGGAGDDAKFERTEVFFGEESVTDAVVALEMLSKKPIGIGVRHGWTPASDPIRVTESDGMKLISLNSIPAIEVIEEHAKATNQEFDRNNPIPFFLHNVLGIQSPQGYKLRVPLSIHGDGSVSCASDIPTGSIVCFMKTTAESAAKAAREATEGALLQLNGNEPSTALVFDCVATRLRIGEEFDTELQAIADTLPHTNFVGCNTYGQVSRVDGQFSGFHNCTAVVCVFPR